MASNQLNIDDIFLAALEIPTGEERSSYLDKACNGDAERRARVERLLNAQQKVGSLFEIPAPGIGPSPTLDKPITEKPGTQIGPYKLLEQIGEGGMGVVYMAEQKEPIKRRVALKIIKPGMDTLQVIARFEAERQALAMMDHPNIAKVLDAGATDSGRPYFVMELVNGLPVTKYCDEQHLTPKERLELFVPICQAVQHAHHKGIIHRDLKPSNILVAHYDGQAVPKVIDFGVAKATNQTLTEKTMFTQLGQIVGTLEYMSPEQAERNQLDIDTRSDIYSLGVVLYELLAGDTPFDRKRLRSAAFDEMLRIIREEEPPKPSTKLSSSETLPSIAANRHVDPQRLTSSVRGELDWIVMKALEKERARRYETASKFAEDVQHYLNDEAVVACPPSVRYRFGKFARRNKGRLVTASLLAVSLLVSVGGVGWAVRDRSAQRAEVAREKTERQERVTTQVELLLGDVNRLMQEQQWEKALVTVRRADAVLAGGDTDMAVSKNVQTTMGELEFVALLTESRMEMSVIIENSFNYAGAVDSYGHAFREFGIDVETLPVATAVAQLKQHPRIMIPVAEALDDFVWARRRKDGVDDARTRSLVEMARGLDHDPVREQLRLTWGNKVTPELRVSLRERAESFDARKHSPSTAVKLARSLGRSQLVELQEKILRRAQRIYPGDFWINLELGGLLNRRKQFAESVRFTSAALAIKPTSTAIRNNLGAALADQGKLDEAIAEFRTAIKLDPKESKPHNGLGSALRKKGELEKAIEEFRTAIELDPKYATPHYNLGTALRKKGQLEEAIAELRMAIGLDPKSAMRHNGLGAALADQGKLDEAIDEYRAAIELDPNDAMPHNNLGGVLRDQGQLEEAIDEFRIAIELDPKFAMPHFNFGAALVDQGKLEEAIDQFRTAIKLDPTDDFAFNILAWQLVGSANTSLQDAREGVQLAQRACERQPTSGLYAHTLGVAYYRARQWPEAIETLKKSIDLGTEHPVNWLFIAMAHWQLKNKDESQKWYAKSVAWREKNTLTREWQGFFVEAEKLLGVGPASETEPDQAPANQEPQPKNMPPTNGEKDQPSGK